MAQMNPKRGAHLSFDTSGEARVYERLSQKLEDDYLVWYNVPVGRARRHPDFIVLHPNRGILVLEIKDWSLSGLHDVSPDSFGLLTQSGLKRLPNPLVQARDYAREIVNLLQADPALQQPPESAHAGKLLMPWAYGVVLTNINRDEFEKADLERVIPGHLVICKDEMLPSVTEENFQQCLWAMFNRPFRCQLSVPQIDRVRGHLFPDLQVSPTPGQFGLFGNASALIPDLMQVMDLQQEQLARSLGAGHRVIHGVAGSGKTMILGYRCLQLARLLHKPVLVLCYNRALSARLASMLDDRGLADRVHVRTFHAWCSEMLRTYNLTRATGGNDDMYRAWVDAVIDGVDKGYIPRGQYGALMVDEGHDFQPEWYKLVMQMIDPDTNSALILYDDAQNIYGGEAKRKFSWKSVGVEAAGRTTVLRLNYRNTLEVLSVARCFANEMLSERESDEDGIPIIAPESAGCRGALPTLLSARTGEEEMQFLISSLRDAGGEGHAWSDMAVLCQYKSQMESIRRVLERAGLSVAVIDSSDRKSQMFDEGDTIKLLTMHSSKGLEFPVVFIPKLHDVADREAGRDANAKLLYVAMTRATKKLVFSHCRETEVTKRVADAIEQVRLRLAA